MRSARIAIAVVVGLAYAGPAAAQTPNQNIASNGPLKNIYIGNELGCQVAHTSDRQLEVYPPATIPGDCGTIVSVAGGLYAPAFSQHGSTAASGLGQTTAWTPVSQTGVTGAGTGANPFTVTTVVSAGNSGLRVTEVDQYIAGQEAYRTDVTLENTGGGALNGILYRAADCFLQENDRGYGFTGDGGAGCSQTANNSPAGRIEQWVPITGGSSYMEDSFTAVWGRIGQRQPFPNTCQCGTLVDNGAGLSWNFSIPPGGRATFAHYTVFSPTGAAGAPRPPGAGSPGATGPRPPAFGPNGVITGLPSARRCVSRRAFRIRIRRRNGRVYTTAQVFLNGRQIAVRRGSRISAAINLRGLPRGRYTVRIVVVTTTGEVITGTRRYRTCARRGGGGRPGPL